LQAFTQKTALGTVRITKTLPDTCPQMLRSKTGCKTVLISRNERKTHCMPSFAISQISQGSKCFSRAYTPWNYTEVTYVCVWYFTARFAVSNAYSSLRVDLSFVSWSVPLDCISRNHVTVITVCLLPGKEFSSRFTLNEMFRCLLLI
jgi:hypothetical protein